MNLIDTSLLQVVASLSRRFTFAILNRRKIQGVRVCQNEDCGLPQNRDRTRAANIGAQFGQLLRGEGPIRPMTEEEEEFHCLNVECADCY